ncbi:hypothetical protein [Shigella sonnei]|uniref:hypothetical protein n=1 Tax=Shigella sonnei TaxID=624 RepID=UPI001C0A91C7|nr:hypothetical protein [Shigella sonnei]
MKKTKTHTGLLIIKDKTRRVVYQGAGVLQQKHWTPLWQPRQSEQTAPGQH